MTDDDDTVNMDDGTYLLPVPIHFTNGSHTIALFSSNGPRSISEITIAVFINHSGQAIYLLCSSSYIQLLRPNAACK